MCIIKCAIVKLTVFADHEHMYHLQLISNGGWIVVDVQSFGHDNLY